MQRARELDLAIKEAARLITEHAWNPAAFSELSRNFGVSKSMLSRRFKRTVQVPYRRFLQAARMAHARELLRTSNLTITEIAHRAGFRDLARFEKVFKAAQGTSPSRYRQEELGADLSRRR